MEKSKRVKIPVRVVFKVRKVADYAAPAKQSGFGWKKYFFVFAIVALVASMSGYYGLVEAANPSANLDQARNGTAVSPTNPVAWVNGNAGSSNSHYTEGQSIPYRITFADLTVGSSYTIEIGFDIMKGGKHAIDFLTRYQRISETVNPCSGITPCIAGTGMNVPTPPVSTHNTRTYFTNLVNAEGAQQFSIYNGNITTNSYTSAGSETSGGDSEAKVSITFTASNPTVVLAWGGHIAREYDWGVGKGATGISGSPYHMRLKSFSAGNVGNQDRSMSASAVLVGNLTVVKHVINDNAGTKTAGDFTMNVTGTNPSQSSFPGSENGTSINLGSGSFTVDESAVSGYTKTIGTGCTGTMVPGDVRTCIITNDDNTPTTGTLTVVKQVTNDNGGTATPSSFSIHVLSGQSDVTGSPQAGNASGTVYTLAGGQYTVSEDPGSGYTADFSACGSQGTVTVTNGQNITCTVVNDDQQAHLTVVKHVQNSYGGTAVAGDFTMNVTGDNVSDTSFAGDEQGTTVSLDAGSYSVDESDTPAGYSKSLGANCSGTIASGESKTCIVTNSDIQPKLTVVKVVDNADNTTTPLSVSDFPLYVDDVLVVSGEQNGFNVGTVKVTETNNYPDYTGAYSGSCDESGNVILGLGDVKTCTITNTYHRPPPKTGTLKVIKHVINDNGGTASSSDFSIQVSAINADKTSFAGSEDGVIVTAEVGDFSVTETENAGYAATYEGCSGTIVDGQQQTCTITNDDIAPKLTVTKVVKNDEGGQAVVSDFILTVESASASTTVTSGVQNTFSAGSYKITESGPTGYTASYKGNCDESGNITMSLNGTYSCEITNTYSSQSADLAVTKTNNAEGSVKPGDSVTFTVTVTNNGPDLAKGVMVDDVWPSGMTFVSATTTTGTFDNDTKKWDIGTLANGASATLELTGTMSQQAEGTQTNTVTVSGSVPDPNSENNTASSSVRLYVKGADLAVTKTVSNSQPNPSETITYKLVVNNLGPDTATGIIATDTLPSTVTFVSATTTQGSYDQATGIWDIGTLPNGASSTLEILATVNSGTQGQSILNETKVSALEADPNLSNNTSSASSSVPSPTPTPTPAPSSGGGVPSSGGGGIPTPPAVPQVLGESTNIPASISMPEGQVLGEVTQLPRTGNSSVIPYAILLIFFLGIGFVKKKKTV